VDDGLCRGRYDGVRSAFAGAIRTVDLTSRGMPEPVLGGGLSYGREVGRTGV